MRSISFHVPQAKEQILRYKFPAQASLMVDPAIVLVRRMIDTRT
jgi:hypothetical protein